MEPSHFHLPWVYQLDRAKSFSLLTGCKVRGGNYKTTGQRTATQTLLEITPSTIILQSFLKNSLLRYLKQHEKKFFLRQGKGKPFYLVAFALIGAPKANYFFSQRHSSMLGPQSSSLLLRSLSLRFQQYGYWVCFMTFCAIKYAFGELKLAFLILV